MGEAETITVEVAYARADQQLIVQIHVGRGTTVERAIQDSGILEHFPEIDLSANKVGIFSKLARLDQPLRDGDRVEIYRPLIADPKQVRKERAAQARGNRKAKASPGNINGSM